MKKILQTPDDFPFENIPKDIEIGKVYKIDNKYYQIEKQDTNIYICDEIEENETTKSELVNEIYILKEIF